ncbi:hypothetical protein [Sphingomonas oryzagri]
MAGTLFPDGAEIGERSSRRFRLNLAIVLALGALAVFIFTPAAEQFARSPAFMPILMTACGGWALTTVWRGIVTGRIQPFAKGFYRTYERGAQPKRFWASLGWNAIFGCMCLWIAFKVNEQGADDRCYDSRNAYSAQEEMTACNRAIGGGKRDRGDMAALTEARGSAYYRLGDYRRALNDYTAAIQLGSQESSSFYNRALA